ncbi:MAG: 50S ribosomal protein L9 [Gammaproteobacteria bacterium]|nr:50S ribosomal protein L9 [Gammaproteobacteria bacterium]|tara:strand:+ start:22214 stop:22675 length:462 start_codon:yes stop_codon:yes gene_type:complete
MKVLLLKKIKNLGDIGKEVSVKPGYARNHLLPKKQAVLPTEENLKIVEEKKKELQAAEEALKSEALQIAEKLKDYTINFKAQVQEEDKIFGSITLQNIVDRLTQDGFNLEKKNVNLPSGPIKNLGTFICNISLHSDVSADISIHVEKEETVSS